MRVQSADLAGAFADYRRAVADQTLVRSQYERSKLLYDKGAVAQKDLEVALDASEKVKVDVETAMDRLKLLGADVDHPSPIIDILAPVSGVVTEQNVTASGGVKTLDNSPNLFTIADLSEVWAICDVYENDLPKIHPGETADIHLNAYPGKTLTARITNIGPILDPAIRTAKIRLEVHNPGMLRLGMFVAATFHAPTKDKSAVVPASAVLHLHDRDWVYMPAPNNTFRRVEVTSGRMLPPNLQEILAGVKPGDQVVASALVLQNTAEQ
jgi:cobalt-zinc-cadmium efflux system membrane fusion protein